MHRSRSSLLAALGITCLLAAALTASAQTLEEALDTTNLVWTTGGDVSWFVQTTNTHDGVDAIQSGVLSSNQTSWIETKIVGPATLSYWQFLEIPWPDHISYGVTVNGAVPLYRGIMEAIRIGGWGEHTYDLGRGTNVVRWFTQTPVVLFTSTSYMALDEVVVTPPRPLSFVAQPSDQTVFSGESVFCSAAIVGTPPYAFQWHKHGVDLLDETNSWLWFVTTTNDSGIYSVTVSNSQGQLTSSNAILTVNDSEPFFKMQPANETHYTGQILTRYSFRSYASGSLPLSYQWKKNGTNLPGATNVALVLSNLTFADAGSYSLLVTNEFGSVESSNATLTVLQSEPPTIIKHPRSLEVAEGVTTRFVTEATAVPAPYYLWTKPGDVPPDPPDPPIPPPPIAFPPAESGPSILLVTNVQPTNAGIYSVIASNFAGTAIAREALLTVLPPIEEIGSWWQGAEDVVVTNGLAYLAQGYAGLAILNVSNPSAPVMLGGFNTPGYANAACLSGGLAFVADGSAGLQILSVTNPFSPVLVGSYDTSGNAYDVAVRGDEAFVADGSKGLLVLDVSDPGSPSVLGRYKTNFSADHVLLSGNLALVSSPYPETSPGTNIAGFFVIDASDPANPVEAGRLTQGMGNMDVRGPLVFGVNGAGFSVVSLTNPAQPTVIETFSSYNSPGFYRVSVSDVRVANDLVFASGNSGGNLYLYVLDAHDPTDLIPVGYYTAPGWASTMWVEGGLAYVTQRDAPFYIIQTPFNTNPEPPPSLSLSAGGGLKLGVQGHLGRHFEIEYADELIGAPWTPLETVFLTNETAVVELPTPSGARFFRARQLD